VQQGDAARTAEFSFRLLRRIVWPKVELAIRLWLGQIFFVSGVIKLTNWHTALTLAATEYPVSWLDPVTAAVLGVAIEVIAGALLTAGLMTRYAAIPMLALALVAQISYLPFDNQLFWIALFGWCAQSGSGPQSRPVCQDRSTHRQESRLMVRPVRPVAAQTV
jgi:NADH dehydrogenase/putative oxidoreductase